MTIISLKGRIKMNYTPYSSNKKGNYVFYIIIIIVLVIIAVIAWVGLSDMNKTENNSKPDTSIIDEPNSSKNNSQEYNSNNSSYNSNNNSINDNNIIPENPESSMPNITPSTPTNEGVKDEPYTQKSYTMPTNGDILKDFSNTSLQYSATFGDMRLHPAVDIACKEGAFIGALTDGKVVSVEKSSLLGNVITIDHGDGLIVKYASVKNSKLKAGDKVKSGDLIGEADTVPNECGDQSHLHLEASQNGKPVSILKFFS